MSKFTNREYRAKAKRPGKRGYGFSPTGRPKVVEADAVALAEASDEDVTNITGSEDVVLPEFDENSTVNETPPGLRTQFDLGVLGSETVRDPIEIADNMVQAEENLTDLAEQEKEMEEDNIDYECAGGPLVADEVRPMSFTGSGIDGKEREV